MTIDVNAYLGAFAFRSLPHRTAPELLRLMDRKRIDRALVSSAASITYRNAHSGNACRRVQPCDVIRSGPWILLPSAWRTAAGFEC